MAAPLLQLGPDSPGMAFGMREQLQLVLHFTHLPCATPNPLLLDQIFVFLKKKRPFCLDTLCQVVSQSRSDDCERCYAYAALHNVNL